MFLLNGLVTETVAHLWRQEQGESISFVGRNKIMYILGDQRDEDVVKAFDSYRNYLENNKGSFPKSAYTLATSDWYYGSSDHKAPHDSWLEALTISESSSGERNEIRTVQITIKLLSAYHDGFIEFHYPEVTKYQISAEFLEQGHGDWRYDEFRIDQNGKLIHEIEWASYGATNTWIIVASDVQHRWAAK